MKLIIIKTYLEEGTNLLSLNSDRNLRLKNIKQNDLKWYPSLSTEVFVNLYRNVSALIGNSSSGIHETPTLKIPAINIGTRQQGRERAQNVIDVPNKKEEILKAIQKAVYDLEFRTMVSKIENPYGNGQSAKQIVDILRTVKLEGIIQKIFHD
jgi:UDP-N-acetylglucosamine 2-epimerase (non-hydrolysing)/GDP/UDP-N,N'-diacetylbacillosamine 2-epimerase (hydrolysing)